MSDDVRAARVERPVLGDALDHSFEPLAVCQYQRTDFDVAGVNGIHLPEIPLATKLDSDRHADSNK